MEIKDTQGNILFDAPVTQLAVLTEELMKQYGITLGWNAVTADVLPVGAYIEHNGVRYSLLEPYSPTQKDEATYEYSPVLQHPVMRWGKALFFFYTYSGGSIVSKELDWSLTDNPANFMSAICDAIENETGEKWSYEVASDLAASASLSFSNTDIFSALNSIASAFETEWWFDYANKVVYLSKAGHGSAVTLEVGQNVGVPQVTQNKDGYYTRFYGFGSTRNIDQSYAGANVNSIVNRRLTLDPAKYPNGYIDIREGLTQEEVLSVPLVFDDIYPRSSLTISDVKVRLMWRLDDNNQKVQVGTDSEGNPVYDQYAIWYFKIPGFTFSKDLLISGKALSAHFNSGSLNGREFELTYHDKSETLSNSDGTDFVVEAGDYEINFVEEGAFIIPAITGLAPVDGNSITLFNIIMPEEYKASAYAELEEAVRKRMAQQGEDRNNYSFESNKVAFYESNPNLSIGRLVTFVNGSNSISTRVIKLETQLDYPFEQRITVGNAIIKGSQQTLKEEVVNANQNIDLLAAINESTEAFQQALQRTQKLMQENMAADLLERVNVGTEEEPVYSVIPKPYKGQPVGIVSDTFITAGGRNGNSSDQGTATTLGGLVNVDDTADNVLTEDVVLFKGINATHWTLRALSTLGINEEKLQTYLEQNKYVTQTFLTDNKYLTKQAADELYMPISEILWKRVNVGTEDNPQWAVIPVDFNDNPVGIVSDTFITSGGRKGGSSGTGSSFNRLDSWDNYNPNAGDVLSAVLGYELKTRLDNLNVGLDESKLKEYLDTNEYITKTAGSELYAPLASFNELNTKFNDFLTGSDIDNTINKWKELEAFLAGQTETSTLADLLAVKADKTALEAVTTRVTTVEGYFTNKAANNALKLGGQLPEYYATASALSTHISTYNTFVNNTYAAHIAEYNTHVTAFNTFKTDTQLRLTALEALWGKDDTNKGLYPKNGYGIYSESYITAGGQGTSGGGSGTGGGLIQNVYGYADLGGTFNNNILTDTFNAYTINYLYNEVVGLKDGSKLPDLSGKYLSLSGGTINGNLIIGEVDNTLYRYLQLIRLGHSVRLNNTDIGAMLAFGAVDNTGYLTVEKYIELGDNGLIYSPNNTNRYSLIHSDNIGSYNAGSATKLQDNTAYTAWGQTFFENGKPKSVSGTLYFDTNHFIRQDTAGVFLYNALKSTYIELYDDGRIVLNNGNVLIGTLDALSSVAKFQVLSEDSVVAVLSTTNATETAIQFGIQEEVKAVCGWRKETGAYIYNVTKRQYLGIRDDGTPHYSQLNGFSHTLWHAGNFNPSNYLPITGGTLKNGTVREVLRLDTDGDIGTSITLQKQGVTISSYGHNTSGNYGVFITNTISNKGVMLGDDGKLWYCNDSLTIPKTWEILHSGNYSSYALSLTGGTIQVNSGTIFNASFANDIFGYNPNYGVYIGGHNSGGWERGYWLYSGSDSHPNPCAAIGAKIVDLIHTGNVAPSLSAGTGNNTKITVGGISSEYKIAYAQDCYDAQWAVSAGKLYGSGYTGINVGSSTQPVYFSSGVPVACTSYANASVNYANSAGNANTLNGYRANFGNKSWLTIPVISNAGVIEIGKYIDFHNDNTSDIDFGCRITLQGDYQNNILLPTHSGTFALLSDNVASAQNLKHSNGTLGATVASNGNVLIGNATDNGYKFDVNGSMQIQAGNYVPNRATLILNSKSSQPGDIIFKANSTTKGNYGWWAISSRNDSTGRFSIFRGAENDANKSEAEIFTIRANGQVEVAGNLVATGAITAGSDARYKTRLQDVIVDIETIAEAPLFTFKWNDREDDRIHLGTTAQYWAQTEFRNAVIPTTDEKLWTMSYSQIAMGNTIVLARELLPIKRKVSEIDNLKNRLHKAERKIEILEQELNQYRRA